MATAKQLAIKGKVLIDGNGGLVLVDPIILLEGMRHDAAVGASCHQSLHRRTQRRTRTLHVDR